MTRTTVTSTLHVTISTRPRSRVRRWIGMHLALLGLYIHHGGLAIALPKIVLDETLEVDEGVTEEEFVERFVARCRMFDPTPEGEAHAREVARTYWEDRDQRAEGPEDCADAEISYAREDGQ